MNKKEYHRLEDFILDDSFGQYVHQSDSDSVNFWNEWIVIHPEKEAEVSKAREVLITLLNNKKSGSLPDRNAALATLLHQIEDRDKEIVKHRFFSPLWIKIAAVIVLSAGLSWLWNTIFIQDVKTAGKIVYNEIIVPVGEKSQVILSDGTHVWINSGSHFKYPVNFGADIREVTLTGEAYFDVTKKGKARFVVNTRDVRIQVLGTAFNVKSYPEDKKTQTTVVRGLVRVESKLADQESVLIRPDQMAVIKNEDESSDKDQRRNTEELTIIKNVNTTQVTCWKDQLLVFADEPFEDIAVKMGRWFNVTVNIEDPVLKLERYTGKFVHNETVYEVLEAIKVTTPITYKVEHTGITITRQ